MKYFRTKSKHSIPNYLPIFVIKHDKNIEKVLEFRFLRYFFKDSEFVFFSNNFFKGFSIFNFL